MFVSAFTVVTLGMPLGATKLYLFGISVDQQFRTEYLTRLTDSPALHDMTYLGLPSFYPPGWFWIGGRVAALTGTRRAWEIYKPWAITSITIAVAVALVLWWRMIRFEYALIVTTATAAVTLAYGSPEPYSAMITVLLPPVLVLTWSGLRGRRQRAAESRLGRAWSPPGYSSASTATWYRCCSAYSAFTMGLMALALAASRWRRAASRPRSTRCAGWPSSPSSRPLSRPPPGCRFCCGRPATRSATPAAPQHYLPADGAELTFPMLQFSLLGAVCLLGTLWLVVRARSSVRAGALAIGVLAIYLWSLLSMLATLARITLLSFRLQPTLTRAAGRRRGVRLRRGHSGIDRARTGPSSRWRRNRTGRGDRVQPGHSRRAAAGSHHRLHRHRRPRPARRPAATELREVLLRHRRAPSCTPPASHAIRPWC